jgi:hypothetical protein
LIKSFGKKETIHGWDIKLGITLAINKLPMWFSYGWAKLQGLSLLLV